MHQNFDGDVFGMTGKEVEVFEHSVEGAMNRGSTALSAEDGKG